MTTRNPHPLRIAVLLATILSNWNGACAQMGDAGVKVVNRAIETATYRASVNADGTMAQFDPGKTDWLRFGPIDDRPASGTCLWQPGLGPLELPEIEQTADNELLARGERGSLRYTFGADGVRLTAENKTARPMFIRMVFESRVALAAEPSGQVHATPLEATWDTVTLLAGATTLKTGGGPVRLTRALGPSNQVLLAEVPQGGSREMTLTVGQIELKNDPETLTLLGAPPLERAAMELYAPADWQVVQRLLTDAGRVRVGGRLTESATAVQARLYSREENAETTTAEWRSLTLDRATRCFEGSLLTAAGGWYRLDVRALDGERVTASATVEHVGIGEVFVVAGQSNSTNSGADGPENVQSGQVSTFDGSVWRPADDPQPGVHDESQNGSPWPAFGDAMHERYNVPIGLSVTGHGGTSVDQWRPGGELFEWMMARVNAMGPGGFRALLWHQGESDVEKLGDEYRIKLARIILTSNERAGWAFPWFVARVSYQDPERASYDTTRDAQKALWDAGIALEGPDTDTLTGDARDRGGMGIHFSSKGLKRHGRMWAEKVGAWLDGIVK